MEHTPFVCGNFSIVFASMQHVMDVSNNLRATDYEEIRLLHARALNRCEVSVQVVSSYTKSSVALALLWKNATIAVGGVSTNIALGKDCHVPWLVGTEALEGNMQAFRVIHKFYKQVIRLAYPQLINCTAGANSNSRVRWLQRLGFVVLPWKQFIAVTQEKNRKQQKQIPSNMLIFYTPLSIPKCSKENICAR